MTNFEEIGVSMQYSAKTRREAERNFRRSCNACCMRPDIRIDCEFCAIDCAHKRVLQSFENKFFKALRKEQCLAVR